MGTQKKKIGTTHVRIRKDLFNELKTKFPNIPIGDTLRMSYDTSLLKVEGKLEQKKFKEKIGGFLYGKKKWEKMFK